MAFNQPDVTKTGKTKKFELVLTPRNLKGTVDVGVEGADGWKISSNSVLNVGRNGSFIPEAFFKILCKLLFIPEALLLQSAFKQCHSSMPTATSKVWPHFLQTVKTGK